MHFDLQKEKADVLAMMRDMLDADMTPTEADVVRCGEILDTYLKAMADAPDAPAGREAVRVAVLALNALDEKTGQQMIETGEREMLAMLIIHAGALRGFNGEDEDVTEEWRTW